jgi:hypothetical protein
LPVVEPELAFVTISFTEEGTEDEVLMSEGRGSEKGRSVSGDKGRGKKNTHKQSQG